MYEIKSENDFVQPFKKFNSLVITIIAQIEPQIKDRRAGVPFPATKRIVSLSSALT
jgi:hypothetical protein